MKENSLKNRIGAIILGAGFGTRLRPLTKLYPKPLIPVCNQPLVHWIIEALNNTFSLDEIIINSHYLSDQLIAFADEANYSSTIKVLHEPEILGTGGPIVNGKSYLTKHEHFILHNGDIISSIPLEKVLNQHITQENIVTMCVLDGPENKLNISNDQKVVDILGRLNNNQNPETMRTYAGIAIFSKEIFTYLPETVQNCSIITAIIKLMSERPGAVGAYDVSNYYWNDLGTIAQYFKIHRDVLLEQKVLSHRFSAPIISEKRVPSDLSLSGFVSLGRDIKYGKNTAIADTIVLNNGIIEDNNYYRDTIIGPEFAIHRDHNELKKLSLISHINLDKAVTSSLQKHGSDRRFYRISEKNKNHVLMLSYPEDNDFEKFIKMGKLFYDTTQLTPRIDAVEKETYAVLMEFVGNQTLLNKVHTSPSLSKLEKRYKRVIDNLIIFQEKMSNKVTSDNEHFKIPQFDYDYLRWETTYFYENYLNNYHREKSEALHNELELLFHQLATEALKQPQGVIHRDFQSQNIVFNENEEIRFVDFQGTRIAPLTYDLMSLINDPYVSLPDELREKLLCYYFENHSYFTQIEYSKCKRMAQITGLQRNMQALGAYGFLGHIKGKKEYLNYIPQGLYYLKQGLSLESDIDLTPLKEVLK